MNKSMMSEINRLRQMTVAELRVEWRRMYGEDSRSRNREFLWRRLAWRTQELEVGGLNQGAKDRIAELAPDSFIRAVTPKELDSTVEMPAAPPTRPKTVRDIRLPSPGSVITRMWRDREIRVVVLDDGFEWNGRRFGSASELARAVTGARWNGRLWLGLTERKRRK